MLGLDEAAERQRLRCYVHFRRGCVLREVLGVECESGTALFETPRHAAE